MRDLLLATVDAVVTVDHRQPDVLQIDGLTAEHIGTIAWHSRLPIYELTIRQASLEEAFMKLTRDSVEYRSDEPAAAVAA